MVIRADVSGLSESNAGTSLLAELKRIYPEGRIRHYFKSNLVLDDPRTEKILTLLNEAGWKPWSGFRDRRDHEEFKLSLHREYDASDLADSSYLELKSPEYLFHNDSSGNPVYAIEGGMRDRCGQIQLDHRCLRDAVDVAAASIDGNWPVIPNRVRELFQSSGLSGVAFRPTVAIEKNDGIIFKLDWSEIGAPWWELTSDIVLPPVSPSMDLRDEKGQAVKPGDLLGLYGRVEGFFAHPELHYRAADLKSLKPFDLAHTFEPFSVSKNPADRPLIASNRFYDLCAKHDLRINWIPVRIDPDHVAR